MVYSRACFWYGDVEYLSSVTRCSLKLFRHRLFCSDPKTFSILIALAASERCLHIYMMDMVVALMILFFSCRQLATTLSLSSYLDSMKEFHSDCIENIHKMLMRCITRRKWGGGRWVYVHFNLMSVSAKTCERVFSDPFRNLYNSLRLHSISACVSVVDNSDWIWHLPSMFAYCNRNMNTRKREVKMTFRCVLPGTQYSKSLMHSHWDYIYCMWNSNTKTLTKQSNPTFFLLIWEFNESQLCDTTWAIICICFWICTT